MKVFADWSINKGYSVILNNTPQTLSTLDFPPETEIYLESGCPKFLLYQLIEKGCKIFTVQGKETKVLREQLKLPKTDENDVKVLQLLQQQKPGLFVEMKTLNLKETQLKYIMCKYEVLTSVTASFKSKARFAEKEYGKFNFLQEEIKDFEKEKKKLIKSVEPLIAKELKLVQIRGISTILTARLLAQAHPKDFSTLSRYLGYCGYKGYMLKHNQKGKGKRPNFTAKMILHLMSDETMRKRTPIFRELYDNCKLRYQTEHPEWKGKIHGKALNIVATFIAKEFWLKLHNIKGEEV